MNKNEILKTGKYNHAEAFCLMKYQSQDGRITEYLWNSRDGVTPFGIQSRDGSTVLYHQDWPSDRRILNHKPQKGDRIFVDLTPEKARQYAKEQVEKHWDHISYPMSDMFESEEAAIEALAESYLEHEGAPDIITVE